MKKFFALALAVMMVASMATVASAESTTTLTTTVPAASYTLNIPADQEITYGKTRTNIGNVTVTESAGFSEFKHLKVTVSYNDFECEGVSTTIPFVLSASAEGMDMDQFKSGDTLTFKGSSDATVSEFAQVTRSQVVYPMDYLNLIVNPSAWGNALAGEYTATITFTATVVVS